jgi:hypothetical protein
VHHSQRSTFPETAEIVSPLNATISRDGGQAYGSPRRGGRLLFVGVGGGTRATRQWFRKIAGFKAYAPAQTVSVNLVHAHEYARALARGFSASSVGMVASRLRWTTQCAVVPTIQVAHVTLGHTHLGVPGPSVACPRVTPEHATGKKAKWEILEISHARV